jgi:hypothetical protein
MPLTTAGLHELSPMPLTTAGLYELSPMPLTTAGLHELSPMPLTTAGLHELLEQHDRMRQETTPRRLRLRHIRECGVGLPVGE